MKKGYLVLENGMCFEGLRFGADAEATGQTVFHTGTVGTADRIADPCFFGQILVDSFPLAGVSGVIGEDLLSPPVLSGYVVRSVTEAPSNFRAEHDLGSWLAEHGIPGLRGVDTRELTAVLRESGPLYGGIFDEVPTDLSLLRKTKKPVYRTEAKTLSADGETKYHLAMLDFGCGDKNAAPLRARGCEVTLLSPLASEAEIRALNIGGLVISDGPEAPGLLTKTDFEGLVGTLPILGLGLGHLLLGRTLGGRIEPLCGAHRGDNIAVRECASGRCRITSQNHGLTVDISGLDGVIVSYVSLNDGSAEGLDCQRSAAMSVAFMPDSEQSATGTAFVYDKFLAMVKPRKEER